MNFETLFNTLKQKAESYVETNFEDTSFVTSYSNLEKLEDKEIKQILLEKSKKEREELLNYLKLFDDIRANIDYTEKTGRAKYNQEYFKYQFNKINSEKLEEERKRLENEKHFDEVIKMVNENYEKHNKGAHK